MRNILFSILMSIWLIVIVFTLTIQLSQCPYSTKPQDELDVALDEIEGRPIPQVEIIGDGIDQDLDGVAQ